MKLLNMVLQRFACRPIGFEKLRSLLKDTSIKIATVVGFPMGYSHTPAKIEECKRAIDEGASLK
jgi:deoxyribose-phosphate aldolase